MTIGEYMKTYLVVGGTSGIGLETTKLLSQNNRVIVLSRDKRNLDGLSNVEFHSADVTKSADELPQIDGSIDGLVYCPGTINLKPLKSLKLEDFQNDFEVNLLGAVKVINKYLNNLKSSREVEHCFVQHCCCSNGNGISCISCIFKRSS